MSIDIRAALSGLISYVEGNECRHEDTHRGGAIWTICDGCGRKWADDRGGFKPYSEPKELTAAIAALDSLVAEPAEQPHPQLMTSDERYERYERFGKPTPDALLSEVDVRLHADDARAAMAGYIRAFGPRKDIRIMPESAATFGARAADAMQAERKRRQG